MQCCWTHWSKGLTLGSGLLTESHASQRASSDLVSKRRAVLMAFQAERPAVWIEPLLSGRGFRPSAGKPEHINVLPLSANFYSLAVKQSSQCWDSTYLHAGAQRDKKLCMTRLERPHPHNTQRYAAFNTGQVTRRFSFFEPGGGGGGKIYIPYCGFPQYPFVE